jgi:hypothetical protein
MQAHELRRGSELVPLEINAPATEDEIRPAEVRQGLTVSKQL